MGHQRLQAQPFPSNSADRWIGKNPRDSAGSGFRIPLWIRLAQDVSPSRKEATASGTEVRRASQRSRSESQRFVGKKSMHVLFPASLPSILKRLLLALVFHWLHPAAPCCSLLHTKLHQSFTSVPETRASDSLGRACFSPLFHAQMEWNG